MAPTGSGTTATVSGDTKANPIVGRIAFWTDDDTCKVNINTASEGTYWDVPRAGTTEEVKLATHQPVQKEFQRYPGHPAMTSLSAVFSTLTYDQIYSLVPRINGGGSDAGDTQTVSQANSTSGVPGSPGPVGVQIIPDADRLYANVDELVFNPLRGNNGGISKALLEQAKFFLTARSRAPEVNLFNLPRIAIWPIHFLWARNPVDSNSSGKAKTNVFDRLIAFCSTINGKQYYFQRFNSKASDEITTTSFPRNAQLYAYLQALTARAVPGFGGNYFAKYGADRDQILTEIFDYIRSANPTDETLLANDRFTPAFFPADPNRPAVGFAQVTPSIKGSTRGIGRVYTLSELAIAFTCIADGDVPASNTVRPENPVAVPAGKIRIKAMLIPEFFSPMMGFAGIVPDMTVSTEVGAMAIGPDSLGFPAGPTDRYYYMEAGRYGGGTTMGGGLSWTYFKVYRTDDEIVSESLIIDKTDPNIAFSGGDMTIKITPTGSGSPQEFKLRFPPGNFPVPTLSSDPKYWNYFTGGDPNYAWRMQSYYPTDSRYPGYLIHPVTTGDVVRSILPLHGDYRLIAGKSLIDDSAISDAAADTRSFAPHPRWSSSDPFASSLSGGTIGNLGLTSASTYFSGVTYPPNAIPDIVPGAALTPALTPALTGDFDTGAANEVDGAYVNKPDQGNTDAQYGIPYFEQTRSLGVNTTFYSPNRQMPSPGMFGSLPTGVIANNPWQTLLFRPQTTHPSHSTTIPDHLLMDLFWMPFVEPYAISEPFSTAGKINLNYQILPFTYITRSTGLQALLKSEKVAAIPDSASATYKVHLAVPGLTIRKTINIPETLSQFTDKFNAREIFRSASEICDIHIVPSDGTAAGMATYWNTRRITGDNLREHIYTTLYPRLTTKSNTYTIHFRAQSLRKASGSTEGTWTDGKDKISGEYRGSTTVERFIESDNASIPDYGANPGATPTLDAFYRWRTVENKQFAP